jgi:hypothetical protein
VPGPEGPESKGIKSKTHRTSGGESSGQKGSKEKLRSQEKESSHGLYESNHNGMAPRTNTILASMWAGLSSVCSKLVLFTDPPISPRQREDYFPIIYGHHCVAVAVSAMYTPFIPQIVCAYCYTLIVILACLFSGSGFPKITHFLWLLLALINLFLIQSGLTGLANADFRDSACL